MATLQVLSRSSEHWLTIMTCNACGETPDFPPIYKCCLGHVLCSSCFETLTKQGVPRCPMCNSVNFKQRRVPPDFLRKLKVKPGIGRPCRYPIEMRLNKSPSELVHRSEEVDKVTMEQIFGLSDKQIKMLFEDRRRMRGMMVGIQTGRNDEEYLTSEADVKKLISSKYSITSKISAPCLVSKQPVTCPHDTCGKMTTISSFSQHFKYEHPEVPILTVERSKELEMLHDVGVIKHGFTHCIAIIRVYEMYNFPGPILSSKKVANVAEKLHQQVPIGTFWLMVSGSHEYSKSKAYAVYWLLTNSEDKFNCQLEISSENDGIICSAFCGTTGMLDNHEIFSIASSIKCLNLTYGAICNLLREGPVLHIKVTVY